MIRGLYTASAGMQAESMRQETIANNLANVNSSGFKKDLALLEAREKMMLSRTNNPSSANPLSPTRRVEIGGIGTGVLLNRFAKQFEQGDFRDTDNPFDLALDGEGFFTVAGANGESLYTRSGEFTLSGEGYLVDKAGRQVLGENGPIALPRGDKFLVGADGTVSVRGRALDRLRLARVDNPDAELEKVGDTAFRFRGEGEPAAATPVVKQAMLEGSNVNSVAEMTKMIMALRQYEANQKSLQAHDETLGKAVNEIARG